MRDKSKTGKTSKNTKSVRTKPHQAVSKNRRRTTMSLKRMTSKSLKIPVLEECQYNRTDFIIERSNDDDDTSRQTPLQLLVKNLLTNGELYKEVQFLDKRLRAKTKYIYESLIYIDKYKQNINILKTLLKENLAIYAETVSIQNSKKQSRKRSLHQRRISINAGTSNLNMLNEKSLETATNIQKKFNKILAITKNVILIERRS